ncbi:TIGR03986 family CRISPR-associated RAMP protein [Megamonas hypermegale]|uniref:TIGR03986 family type III CRISPR-associated RAMP protein n=1 Tax=Megamonas hypermegale TaxID=158847 RepID=UPI0026F0B31A|nr:TIGR03986 family CRISPR-associated RAMP protein [Megamonas hypermegale]
MGKKDKRKEEKKVYSGLDSLAEIYGREKPKERESNRSFTMVEQEKPKYVEKNPVKRTENLNRQSTNKPVNRTNTTYKSGNNYVNNFKKSRNVPTAPYNFVPLNDTVVHPPLFKYIEDDLKEDKNIQSGYKRFLQENGKYSGFFDVDIENITPIYIGGENKKFFSIGGKYCIPGSSLRGSLKNIFKIITNGAMRVKEQISIDENDNAEADVTNKILYFRNLAGKKVDPTKDLYSSRFTYDKTYKDKDGNIKTKKASIAKAGFLVRENKQYYICRADVQVRKGSPFQVTPPKAPCIEWNNDFADIFTGRMNNKKHFYRIKSPVWKDKYIIPDDVLKGYRDDKNRKGLDLLNVKNAAKGTDRYKLLRGAEKFDYIVPCFFVEKDGVVEHFGAGPYYRLPYRNSIGDHIIPEELKKAQIDFTDAIFGNKEYWKSRVNFEDCYLQSDKSVLEAAAYSKILMGPNPTSFQLYLTPDKDNNPRHWDSNAPIRGYKFYWHRSTDWRAAEKSENENMNNFIAPIKANNHFKGRVRFENLDAVELGALSYVFALAEEKDICYKIGMGKPIGMGSIKIKSKLYLRGDNYYKQLFAENGFAENLVQKDKDEYVKQFKAYMQNNLSAQSLSKYQSRINQLKAILSVEYMQGTKRKEWNEKLTRYMEIGNKDDRNIVTSRTPLPTINEVVQALKK